MNHDHTIWSQLNYGTASILEIIWTVVGIVGLLTVAWLLHEAFLDRAAVGRSMDFRGRTAEKIIAEQNVRRLLQKVACFAVFVGIGIAAILTPPPVAPTAQPGPSLYAVALSSGLVLVEVLLTLSAIQDRRDRLAVIMVARMRRKEDGGDPGLHGA
jgi:hypothetical protein